MRLARARRADTVTAVEFDDLLHWAETVRFEGWDFSVFGDRYSERSESWSYRELLVERIADARSMLDMGTGGGEFLASLPRLPERTLASEGWAPNQPVARRRLAPSGVEVVDSEDSEDAPIPLPDDCVELIANRHEAFRADELRRVLRNGGEFLTQQVGGDNLADLNRLLDAPPPEAAGWSAGRAAEQLREHGFSIEDQREEHPAAEFADVGALALYLRVIAWQIPDYTVERYRERLWETHRRILRDGPLRVSQHRFLVRARLAS